jgi:2-polyprenyl-3-methyl-5-hydroxy-6-metoxy-1,4-benzoquinol methylase
MRLIDRDINSAVKRLNPPRKKLGMKSNRLTDVEYWNKEHDTVLDLKGEWIYGQYLDPFMPRGKELNCLEIGVYPGRYLLYLAHKYGYKITGIDFSPHIQRLATEFYNLGVNATLIQADFLEWSPKKQFDVVVSHGFIEHFNDYQSIIERHWQLVKPGGIMILSVPVLTPFQYVVRLVIYTSEHFRYILGNHNTEIMNLSKLREAVSKCRGSEIVTARYVKWMRIWFTSRSQGVRRWTAPLFPFLRFFNFVARKLDICNGLISPEIVVAAKKKK